MRASRMARRVGRGSLLAIAVVATFVTSLVLAVLVHLGSGPARRVVARALPSILAGVVPGEIRVRSLGGLGVRGIGGVDVDLVHPDRRVVARLRDVEVTLDPVRAVKSVLGSGPIEIPIRSVSADALDLDVSMRGGQLRIADVFVDPNAPEAPDDPSARGVDVEIRAIAIRHVWAHGTLEADGLVVDADFDDLRARFAMDDDDLSVVVERVDLATRQAPRGADVHARLSAAFSMPFDPPPGTPAQSAFWILQGSAARTPVSSVGILIGEGVHGWLWLPEVTPDQVRAVAPEAPPLAAPASVVAVVDGTFDALDGRVMLAAGKTRLDAVAHARLSPGLAGTAHVEATDLDASLVGGPASAVSLGADAEVAMPEGGDLQASATLRSKPGVVAGVPIPAVAARGHVAGTTGHAELTVEEPGLRTDVVADLSEGARGPVVDVTLRIPDADLSALKRRGFEASGRLHARAAGRVDLGAQHVTGTLELGASDLAARDLPGVRVATLQLDARADGALTNPVVHAKAAVRGVEAAERHVQWATISAEGPALRPFVAAEVSSLDLPSIRGRATVDVRRGPAIEGIDVEARRGTTTAHLVVPRVVLGGGIPRLDGVELNGLGEPIALSVVPEGARGTRVVASAPSISIPAVTQLAGLDLGVREGKVAAHGDVLVGAQRFDGELAIDLQDLDLRRDGIAIDDVDLSVRAASRKEGVTFSIDSETRALGFLHVHTTEPIQIAGPQTAVASWRDARGAVHVEGDLRIAPILKMVPESQRPVLAADGRFTIRGDFGRARKGAAPSLDLAMATHDLVLVGKPAPTPPAPGAPLASYAPRAPNQSKVLSYTPREGEPEASGAKAPTTPAKGPRRGGPDPTPAPAWTLRGIDVVVRGQATPDPAHLDWNVTARDAHGALVVVGLRSDVAYGRLLEGNLADTRWIEEAPLSLTVSIPSRKIDDLPPLLGIPKTPGNVVLDARVEGTLGAPELSVDGALAQISIEDGPLEEPFTVKVLAHYDGNAGQAAVALDQSGRRLAKVTAAGRVALRDVLHPKKGVELPWTASADAELGPLPLDVLEPFLSTKIDGVVRGHVKLDKLHEDASIDADVGVDGLVLGGIRHREAKLKVVTKDGKLTGTLRMVQPDGSLDANADIGIAWGTRVVPELRASEAFAVGVRARAFRLRAVEPFLATVVNRLDGRLDGDVRLSKEAVREIAQGRGVKGKLSLSRGSVEVAAGGGPLEGVRGTLRIDDSGVVRLEDVFARGTTGEVRAVGAATFDAAGFHEAKLNVVIPEKAPMPLLLSGEHLADVSANVKVSAKMIEGGRELAVGVDIPRLEVLLPDTLPDGVQKLDEAERIRIGTIRGGDFIPLAVDAPDPVAEARQGGFRTRVTVALVNGRIVKGDMLSTYLRGNPTILIDGNQTTMSGAIRLTGGRVDIKGRRFEIESGTITFTGDPANPDVLLTAKWKAPDDTMIYADFAGPLTTGKVQLRSDPPRSREEILALVIFGRVEGYSSGGQEADKATQAVGVAGGFATQGLNKVLDDVTDVEIRTRVDTSSSTNPRPELEVQISQEIAARIAYVLGELAPGQSPDKTYATLDWSFRPEWSLETTVGDRASTTVDLIWERRY